ncbi:MULTISPECIES: DUF262 domain-containing protein [unclassified Streptomyces]|uniref:DUF262 domain-containing protein n=1 Tax=unclassified Streptomyces TaxID=2593676 RepID=UPI002E2AF3AD|nr:DUF262 domain-containing protein [Streptomyces sp. NBC_00223]
MNTAGLDTQPSADTYELDDLIPRAWAGQVRVPHFQRSFRWGTDDVLRLFDSIVRGYPIGSLLLWVRHSPAGRITLGALSIDAQESENALWVVDGQQRITSLANALHPEGNLHAPFNVFYDLAEKSFIARPAHPQPHQIAVHVLFDLDALLDYFDTTGKSAKEYFPVARQIAKRLRQFKIPVYLVKQEDQDVLTDIFDRMNNFGKRLSRAEIFSSLFAGDEEGADDRLTIASIAAQVDGLTGFGIIDDDTVLHAMLARRGPDPSREIRLEFDDTRRRTKSDFPGESRDTAYAEGMKALLRAVTFLQETGGVPHLSMVPYKALIVVFARFFAHFPEPEERHLQLLRRLYWRVVLAGPAVFKGSFTSLARVLCSCIYPQDEQRSVRDLLHSMKDATPYVPSAQRFRTNEAVSKIILCSWWELRPRSPFTGEAYDFGDLAGALVDRTTAADLVYRIFPRGIDPSLRFWAANRLFLPSATDPAQEFPARFTQRPLALDDTAWDAVLHSYCLDDEAVRHLRAGDAEGFLRKRQQIVEAQLENFLSRMAEWEYEDTPALQELDFDSDADDADEWTELPDATG